MNESSAAFASQKYRVNGIEMNVVIEGEGPDVLLIHGFPDTHAVWRKQIPALVAAGYRVIAPDTRGCGDTEAPLAVKDYAVDILAADMIALLDLLGIAKVKLVAHDWGANIGWQLCIHYPQRVERYAALSVGHPNAYAGAGLEQKIRGYYILVLQLRWVAEFFTKMGNWLGLRVMARFDAELPHWKAALSRPGRLTAGMNYYRANLRMMLLKTDWPKAKLPVLGIWSDGDIFLTEKQVLNSVDFVEGSFLYKRIEGANHWLQLTAPNQVNALLLDYLGSSLAQPVSPG